MYHVPLSIAATLHSIALNSCFVNSSCVQCIIISVPARLGKGHGAKEIRHNLARERPKFGHNLVRKRHKIGHSLERVNDQNSVTIQHANETRSWHSFVGD